MLFYTTLIEDKGNEELLNNIYNTYKKRMLFVANSISHDYFEAKDAVQNAFMGIAKNISVTKALNLKEIGAYIFTAA